MLSFAIMGASIEQPSLSSEDEKRLAEESKRAIEQSKRFFTPIVTQVTAASDFFQAEEYHQDFYKKNPIRAHKY